MPQEILTYLRPHLEKTFYNVGITLKNIADFPPVKPTCKFLKQDWLLHILGEIDESKVTDIIRELKQQYPDKTPEEITQQIIFNQSLEGAKLGLVTNIIPPIALLLIGFELSAMTKLQTQMVAQLAAHYDFDLTHPSRRGENLAIIGLSLGGDIIKIPLNFVELIPGFGAVVGASANAINIYCLGMITALLYEYKDISKVRQKNI